MIRTVLKIRDSGQIAMAVFEYKALNEKGKKESGLIDAESLSAAKLKLRTASIFPVSLSKIEAGEKTGRASDLSAITGGRFFGKIGSAELAMITRQLSTLLSAGFPLVKALETLVPQTRSAATQKMLSKLKDTVEEGASFAQALSLYPGIFSPIFVNMVAAGESSGTLELVLERLADLTESREETKKKIQAALAYPIMMSLIGAGVLIILLTYVVPGIVGIFSDLNQTLPLPTRILISVSSFLTAYWWAVAGFPLLLAGLILLIRRTEKGGRLTDRLIISLPVTGSLVRKMIAARLCRTLGSLLENGVPLLTALTITRTVTGNRIISDLVTEACETVEQGGALSRVFANSTHFPYLAAQMISLGESSGELETMLEKTADLFEKDVQAAVTAATSLIEPLIILIMGVVVGSMIFAICMPIFEINQFIR